MSNVYNNVCYLSAAVLIVGVHVPHQVAAQSLNYDTLATLEEPLAFAAGDITFELRGLLDGATHYNFETDSFDPRGVANFQIDAETQLPNRWTIRASYFGQYSSDPGDITGVGGGGSNDRYSDNAAGFVGGAWGTVFGGNVTGIVREETRRVRGVGNAALAFDNAFGGLDTIGAGYIGRFGPAVLAGVVDPDGLFDVGGTWSRPIGKVDYSFSLRGNRGEFISQDNTTVFDTYSISGVADVIYGSSTFDLGVGYESFSSPFIRDLDRWFVSAGGQHKIGALTVSLEGHIGELDGNTEQAIAAGVQYDIARGLSANWGVNHAKLNAARPGVVIERKDATEAIFSLRYSY